MPDLLFWNRARKERRRVRHECGKSRLGWVYMSEEGLTGIFHYLAQYDVLVSYENGQCVEGVCRGPSSMVSVDLGEGGRAGVNSN